MNILVQHQPAYVYTGKTGFESSKSTVLFIHGAANDHQVWIGLIDSLNLSNMNTLAVDLPGHGKTFESAKSSVSAYADWIIDLLDNAAISQAVLVGHSMGSLVALDCAARFPDRVSKFVLIGSAMPMPVADALLATARDQPEEAFDLVTRWSHFTARNADGSFPPPTAVMQQTRALLAASRPGVLANDLNACKQFQMNDEAFADISAPAIVLIGAADKMTPAIAGEGLCNKIPNCKLVAIGNAGHAVMLDAPEQTRDAILNFLK